MKDSIFLLTHLQYIMLAYRARGHSRDYLSINVEIGADGAPVFLRQSHYVSFCDELILFNDSCLLYNNTIVYLLNMI
jgi:hypothetical protein